MGGDLPGHCPCPGAPGGSGGSGGAAISGADLRPLCAARFVRLAADLHYGESRLELALDRGSLLGGSREAPIFEVEAELKAGQDADVLAFGTFLETAYGLVPEHKSKFKRARDLALEGR